ncbi:hypothetical protein ARMGADRAFT_1029438 [Armillaria gallica]|uniref:KOW domain-containing protein n=1 Tax=Armillaria gallica TaxID=47427 RepID=A0A2H3DYX1_ARMGA|nr:hypothetical protein ARMGADRAFT_1029438 [Armillaria gallica]
MFSCLPRISEGCFQVGEKITDTSGGQLGTIRSIGQYVEISEEMIGDRWSGWITAVENEMLELICHHASTMETCSVHSNAIIAMTVPNGLRTAPAMTSPNLEATPNVPWKGMMIQVTRKSYHWGGKRGYLIDVNVIVDINTGNRVLKVLVQLVHYNPNAPFVCVWFSYNNVVEEESWLPLNEAQPLEDKHEFFHDLVLETNILIMKSRCILTPELFLPEEPGNATPLLDPSECCLSPAWNPSSPDPPLHWCLDPHLLSAKFHMSYNGHKIMALVKRDWQRNIHCGKWVRSIQFKKCSPDNSSDLVWTVAIIIPRAPFLLDDVTDETLMLHNSMMTLAEQTKESKTLNSNLKKQLRLPSQD